MGSRGHGTWAKLYGDVWTHEKTMALARGLEDLGVPAQWSLREAVGELHELLIWCLANGDDGEVGHLRPAMFARAVGWPDAGSAPALLELWKASGFLDVDAPGSRTGLRVHDFHECAGDIITKRIQRRDAKIEASKRTPHVGHADAARTPHGRRTDASRARSAAAAAATHTPQTPLTVETKPDDHGSVCVSAAPPDRGGQPSPQGEAPPSAEPDDLAQDSDSALLARWNAGRQRRTLTPQRGSAEHSDAWVRLREASGSDPQLALLVVDAWFAETDPFVRDAAWSLKVFPHRLDAMVIAAKRRRPTPTAPPPEQPSVPMPSAEATRDFLDGVTARMGMKPCPRCHVAKTKDGVVCDPCNAKAEREAAEARATR